LLLCFDPVRAADYNFFIISIYSSTGIPSVLRLLFITVIEIDFFAGTTRGRCNPALR
jgi:hypothetical protein